MECLNVKIAEMNMMVHMVLEDSAVKSVDRALLRKNVMKNEH